MLGGVTWPEAHTDAQMMADLALASYQHGCFENVGVPFCMTIEAEELGAKVTLGSKIFEPHVTEYAGTSVTEWKKIISDQFGMRESKSSIGCNPYFKRKEFRCSDHWKLSRTGKCGKFCDRSSGVL